MIFTGNGEKGGALPLSDWGLEFAEDMPEQIKDAIRRARGEVEGSIHDLEYRKRLQDKFGDRWTVRRIVQARTSDASTEPATPRNGNEAVLEAQPAIVDPLKRKRRKQNRLVRQIRLRAASGGVGRGVERDVPVDVPAYRYATKDNFDKEWHVAQWAAHDPSGPTVILNQEAPLILEAIKFHQEQYPDVHAEEIQKIVMQVYGEVAVSKIAHSQKLANRVSEEDLDDLYRSDEALTFSLMGLLAEETVIAQRLGRLGRKKSAA